MQELIAAAAAATGWPESMVERSARARAKAEGVEVEAVLSAWAGGDAVAATPTAAAAPAAEPPAPAPAAEAAPSESAAELEVEVIETAPAPEPEPIPEPEAPRISVPTWLAASFVVIPAIAIMYALFFPNGPDCGVGPQLALDPVSGVAENCDGSAFGADTIDLFALGEPLYARNCAACHGANGEGGGNFPALNQGAVVATFPSCQEQIDWVALGSLGWPDATYGANATPVGSSGAQMPGFGNVLSPQELAAVIVYERVAHGGLSVADALPDCGPGAGSGVEAAGE